jgi:outer membrane protein
VNRRDEMLRITIHDNGGSWRLQLEGKLVGPWVAEAESAWTGRGSASELTIDLTDVSYIDDAGQNLLRTMHQSGAHFVACGVAMKALVNDIKSHPISTGTQGTRKLGVLAFLGFLALSPSLRAQQAPAPMRLTLKDAVNIALKQNPQVAIANLNLLESQQSSNVARSALLPQVSLAASDRVTRGNIQALLGTRIPGFPQHNGPFWTIQAGPEFSTPIFDLTLWHRWQAARQGIKTSTAEQTTARELNVQLVVSQYLGSLRAAADVTAARSRLDLAKALFDLASDLQKNGVGTGIDTLRANVEYQNELQKSTQAQTELKTSLYGLSRLLNLPPEQQVELADARSFFDTPEFGSDESLERAYVERPEMKSVLSQIRAAQLEKRAAKEERLPRLSLSGTWTLQGVSPTNMIPVYQYGANFEMPLFTGGRIEAQTAIADLEIKKLQQTEQETRNRIALEVKTAVAQIESARVEVDAANLGVTLATEGVTQAQDRFRAGVANNIEVITAQDELARANDNQITALYRYNQSRADLARATGQMEALYTK